MKSEDKEVEEEEEGEEEEKEEEEVEEEEKEKRKKKKKKKKKKEKSLYGLYVKKSRKKWSLVAEKSTDDRGLFDLTGLLFPLILPAHMLN